MAQNDTHDPAANSGGIPDPQQQTPSSAGPEQPRGNAGAQSPAPANGASGVAEEASHHPSGNLPAPKPIPLIPAQATWNTFHGQLNAQKYSPLTQITADNVKSLVKVWEYHTGDVSDGSGDRPTSVWSATPIFANDTLYIGTPFYRVIALDPGTGKVKWTFDSKSTLKALTQPALKNRGVAYWQSPAPVAGQPCQKIADAGHQDGLPVRRRSPHRQGRLADRGA
jgi:quinoprotein glucose dehydrogenase